MNRFRLDRQSDTSSSTATSCSSKLQSILRSYKIVDTYNNIFKTLADIKELSNSYDAIFNHIDSNKNAITWNESLSDTNKFNFIPITGEGDIAGVVAFRKEQMLIKNLRTVNEDHPNILVRNYTGYEMTLLCTPVENSKGDCIGVLELYKCGKNAYSELMMQYVKELCYWIGIQIEQSIMALQYEKINSFADKLMASTIAFFAGETTFTIFLTNLVATLRSSILADRFILYAFINDSPEVNVYAEMFMNEETCMDMVKRLKLKKNTIVRKVAASKELFNSKVPPNDPRIDPEIHKLMTSPIDMLCAIPLIGDDEVLGVFEILNKQNQPETFTLSDLEEIQVICNFLTAALRKRRVCQQIIIEAGRKDLYEELLRYQLIRRNVTWESISGEPEIPEGFNEFGWVPEKNNNLSQLLFYIISDTCPELFITETLQAFIFAVRALHRDNFYANFNQTCIITHAVYALIKIIPLHLDKYEKAGLLLASCARYMDYRGLEYNTLKLLEDPLTKILERDHYRYELGFYLFEYSKLLDHLRPDEISYIMNIFKSILCNFKTQKDRYTKIIEKNLNMNDQIHRSLILNFLLYCVVYGCRFMKNFRVYNIMAENVYREKYMDGDIEIKMGIIPLPEKDRKFKENMPHFELKYMEKHILPSFKLLKDLFPSTDRIYEAAMEIYNCLDESIELRGKKTWFPDESVGIICGEGTKAETSI